MIERNGSIVIFKEEIGEPQLKDGKLQQEFIVLEFENFQPKVQRYEWRDVP